MNTKVIIGVDKDNKPHSYDIKYMPHMLIAGQTGSGKSQFIHSLVLQLIDQNTSEEIKFIMSDCNRVELVQYSGIPYLYSPIQTEAELGVDLFEWLDYEQNRRYELFLKHRVRGIDDLNEKFETVVIPRIIVFIDELAHLRLECPDKSEKSIVRIAQLSKASGIHMVIATQSPSGKTVTGLIKANIPTRIAFKTNTFSDSRLIIDQPGAEKLNGKGDMLFIPPESAKPTRLQGRYVSDKEISDHVEKIRIEDPQYNEALMFALRKKEISISDDIYKKAIDLLSKEESVRTSFLQRSLSIGYAKATAIMDMLEKDGIVSSLDQVTKTRKVLINI